MSCGFGEETSLWLSLYFCETTVFEVISPLVRRLLVDEPGLLVLPWCSEETTRICASAWY